MFSMHVQTAALMIMDNSLTKMIVFVEDLLKLFHVVTGVAQQKNGASSC